MDAEKLQISVQYQLLAALQEREHDLAEAQRLARIGSWSHDLIADVGTWSDELCRILGVEFHLAAPSFDVFVSHIDAEDRAALLEAVGIDGDAPAPFDLECRVAGFDPPRWIRVRGVIDRDIDGVATRNHGTAQDITEEVHARALLEDVTQRYGGRDPVTGLASHADLLTYARQALSRAERHRWSTAVFVLDIHGLGEIGDDSGTEAVNSALAQIAARLVDALRSSDAVGRDRSGDASGSNLIGRLGGERFVVIGENVADLEAAHTLAARLTAWVTAPMVVDGVEIDLTMGAGVAIAGPDGPNVEQRIVDAEAALGVDEDRGGAEEQALRRAFDDGEFVLHYQPKLSLEADRIAGAEGLLRWLDPARGLVPPLDFIPLAEATGLIVPIGAWVIEEACRQVVEWDRLFPRTPGLAISVNVSPRQFGSDLVETVRQALRATGIAPAQLCLEVTESLLMVDGPAAVATLSELAALGVKLSIDDFGTGYSSLAYLKRFPLHELKIDKSFVDGLGKNTDDTAIVAATVAMAHALGLSVIAEGVETAEQLERLRVLGCQDVQGYFVSRPKPADEIASLLANEDIHGWRGAMTSATDPAASGDRAYRAECVLVVDDAEDVRQLAQMTLTAVGFEVHAAGSGAEGLALALEHSFDCIILDVSMPDMTGIEVCQALRARPATADCTILMLTSNAGQEDKVNAFASGADDYIVKPFSPRDLVGRVRAAIRQRSAEGATT